MENKLKLVYVDPQSGSNLALYDYSLLNGLECETIYCCSTIYNERPIAGVVHKPIFKYNGIGNPILKGGSYLMSLVRLLLILARVRPDVLHIQWWRLWYVDYVMLFLYRLFVGQIVYTAHNVVPHDSGGSMIGKCRKYYRKVDKIIVHVPKTKVELQEQFGIEGHRIFVCRHGILSNTTDKRLVDVEKQRLSELLDLDGKIVFSALGFQNEYKGTFVIKKMFLDSGFLQRHPDVVLLVGGKGDIICKGDYCLDNLYVNDSYVSDEEFMAMMKLTDVLLLPYLKISQSGALLTAIDMNIPYIATDVGGICEPLDIAPVGWRLKSATVDELETVIENILLDRSVVKRIKSDLLSWNKIKAQYDWSTIQKNTMKCYLASL